MSDGINLFARAMDMMIEQGEIYFKPDPRIENLDEEPELISIYCKKTDEIVGCVNKVEVFNEHYAWHFSILRNDSYHGKVSQMEYAYRGNWITDILYDIQQNYFVLMMTGELNKK